MSCCLLSLHYLLKTLPKEDIDKIHSKYELLISKERFWNVTKIPGIVSSFLTLLDQILIVFPDLLKQNFYDKIFQLFIQCFKSKDRNSCQLVWKPLIRLFRDHSNEILSVNPKIYRQLKEQIFAFFSKDGTAGSDVISYPSLAILVPYLNTMVS